MHIAMIGDSVFDNASYVGDAPDVRAQLQCLLSDAEVSSSARDGAVMADIPMQLRQIPRSATHIVVSVGGNDAIGASGVIDEGAVNVADALEKLAVIRDRFDRSYGTMIDLHLRVGCTPDVDPPRRPCRPRATGSDPDQAAALGRRAMRRIASYRHVPVGRAGYWTTSSLTCATPPPTIPSVLAAA